MHVSFFSHTEEELGFEMSEHGLSGVGVVPICAAQTLEKQSWFRDERVQLESPPESLTLQRKSACP